MNMPQLQQMLYQVIMVVHVIVNTNVISGILRMYMSQLLQMEFEIVLQFLRKLPGKKLM